MVIVKILFLLSVQNDGIWSNFAYAFTYNKQIYNRLIPLVVVSISFPLNILWTNRWNSIKFCICIDSNKI